MALTKKKKNSVEPMFSCLCQVSSVFKFLPGLRQTIGLSHLKLGHVPLMIPHAGYRSLLLVGAVILFFGFIAAIAFPRPLGAAEWSLQPTLTLGLEYDENLALTTAPHDSTSGFSITPQVNVTGASERSKLSLDILLNYTEYSGGDVEDTNEQVLSLSSYNQTTERTRWGLDGDFRRDTLLSIINIGTGTGELTDTDVGLARAKVRRDRRSLEPSWTRQLSERNSLGLRYEFVDVGFSDTAGTTGLEDYEVHTLAATFSREITSRDDFNLGISTSRFKASDKSSEADTVRIAVGMTRAFSETANGTFSIGASETEETIASKEEKTSGFILEARAEQKSELTTLDGVISRDVYPSGGGRAVQSDQLRVNLLRKISPKLNFELKATLFRNKVVEGSDPDIDRRYYEVEPGLSWQWTPHWFVNTSYRYRRQKFDAEPDTAKSNAVFLGVAYNWRKQAVSR